MVTVDWTQQDATTKKRYTELWAEISILEKKIKSVRAQISTLNDQIRVYQTEIDSKKAEIENLPIVYSET